MPRLDTVDNSNSPQHCIIYGPPKSGKTELAGSLAEHGYNLHWLDLENGAVTLINSRTLDAKKRINLIRIPDTKEIPRAIETVSQLFAKPGMERAICWAHGRINCPDCMRQAPADFDKLRLSDLTVENKDVLVIDSFTQLADSCMAHVAKDVSGMDLNDPLGSYSRIEFKHYDAQGRILAAILSSIQAAPFHVILISHEQSLGMEDSTEKITPSGGTKNFSKKVAKYFDHVVYCQLANRKHVQSSATTDSAKVLAGSRSNISLANGAGLVDIFAGKVEKQNFAAAIAEQEKQEVKALFAKKGGQ